MDCLRWSKTFLRIAEITLHILTILRASCSREGIINCINWRNSIEFKFYGNQFHCARHRWRQWCDDEAAAQQKTKKIPPVISINPKISRASIIFNKVDTYVLMLIKLAAGLQSILRYLTLSPELRNKVSEIIAEYSHLLSFLLPSLALYTQYFFPSYFHTFNIGIDIILRVHSLFPTIFKPSHSCELRFSSLLILFISLLSHCLVDDDVDDDGTLLCTLLCGAMRPPPENNSSSMFVVVYSRPHSSYFVQKPTITSRLLVKGYRCMFVNTTPARTHNSHGIRNVFSFNNSSVSLPTFFYERLNVTFFISVQQLECHISWPKKMKMRTFTRWARLVFERNFLIRMCVRQTMEFARGKLNCFNKEESEVDINGTLLSN